jgi:hypothetical protein
MFVNGGDNVIPFLCYNGLEILSVLFWSPSEVKVILIWMKNPGMMINFKVNVNGPLCLYTPRLHKYIQHNEISILLCFGIVCVVQYIYCLFTVYYLSTTVTRMDTDYVNTIFTISGKIYWRWFTGCNDTNEDCTFK